MFFIVSNELECQCTHISLVLFDIFTPFERKKTLYRTCVRLANLAYTLICQGLKLIRRCTFDDSYFRSRLAHYGFTRSIKSQVPFLGVEHIFESRPVLSPDNFVDDRARLRLSVAISTSYKRARVCKIRNVQKMI